MDGTGLWKTRFSNDIRVFFRVSCYSVLFACDLPRMTYVLHNGSPSISIIIRNQKVPVSFHTAHPSISIQKFCHSSNSIQESLLFPHKVENGCFLKNNHSNIPKACAGQSKNSSSEGKYSTILTMETLQGVVNL